MIEGFLSALWGSGLNYLIPFLFVLTVVVFVHEMGHYLVGRLCGVGVKSFSIGFGPELFGWTARNGTRWRLSAIPLGGYVKFAGDLNSASVPDPDQLRRMTPQERSESFHEKSVGRRAAIVAAGPIANFILAIAIFAGSAYLYGFHVHAPRIDSVVENSAASRAGLQAGDVVLSVNGSETRTFTDIQRTVMSHAGERLTIRVRRGDQELSVEAVPDLREIPTKLGVQRIGQLGIRASTDPAALRHEQYGLADSLKIGVAETWFIVERTGAYFGKLVTGRESIDQISGVPRIAQAAGYMASFGFKSLLSLTALLSVSIGLINLVPIPLLDGGHLLFYGIEAVRGRPLSERAQEFGFRIGLAFVVTLMLVATWNDMLHFGALLGVRG